MIDGVTQELLKMVRFCQRTKYNDGVLQTTELTAEVMTGEWFHTGDIGVIEMASSASLIKKEMFKTLAYISHHS